MPAWLRKEDEGLWEKAKAAALESHKESEDGFYAIVTAIFKRMGGVPAKAKASDGAAAEGMVQAAGTSEGAHKGWIERLRRYGYEDEYADTPKPGVTERGGVLTHKSGYKVAFSLETEPGGRSGGWMHYRRRADSSREGVGLESLESHLRRFHAPIKGEQEATAGIDDVVLAAIVKQHESRTAQGTLYEVQQYERKGPMHKVGDVVRRVKLNPWGQGAVGSLHTVTVAMANRIWTRPHGAETKKVGGGWEYTEDSGAHDEFESAGPPADKLPTKPEARKSMLTTYTPELTDKTCVACGGTGQSTSGKVCAACQGTGKLLKSAVGGCDATAVGTVTAAGTSEGARKGWEERNRKFGLHEEHFAFRHESHKGRKDLKRYVAMLHYPEGGEEIDVDATHEGQAREVAEKAARAHYQPGYTKLSISGPMFGMYASDAAGDDRVQAAWSDAAREAALESRKRHEHDPVHCEGCGWEGKAGESLMGDFWKCPKCQTMLNAGERLAVYLKREDGSEMKHSDHDSEAEARAVGDKLFHRRGGEEEVSIRHRGSQRHAQGEYHSIRTDQGWQKASEPDAGAVKAAGTSEGAKKGWSHRVHVSWTDRDYKPHRKTFYSDPLGAAENDLHRARAFAERLKKEHSESPYGTLRELNIEQESEEGAVKAATGAYGPGHEFHGNQWTKERLAGAMGIGAGQQDEEHFHFTLQEHPEAKGTFYIKHGSGSYSEESAERMHGKLREYLQQSGFKKVGESHGRQNVSQAAQGQEHWEDATHRVTMFGHGFSSRDWNAGVWVRPKGQAKAKDHSMSESNIILCRAAHGVQIPASEPWVAGEPVQFVYAPQGQHTITAGFRKNETITICVIVDEGTAGVLQDSFEHLCATQPKQEPYADEDHAAAKATLRFPPATTRFTWGKVKEDVGIVVAGGEPTSYGAEAVNGKVYRAWSPEFTTDAEMDKAVFNEETRHWTFPDGVRGSESNPARLNGVNFVVGALTNRPAFRAMPPVKAKQADVDKETVQAVGTSESVRKAWQTRHGRYGAESLHVDKPLAAYQDDDMSAHHLKAATQALGEVGSATGFEGGNWRNTYRAHLASAMAFATGHIGHHSDAQHLHSQAAQGWKGSEPVLAQGHHKYAGHHSQVTQGKPQISVLGANDAGASETVQAAGTSEGVRKSWASRARHHNSLAQSAQMDFQSAAHQASESAYKASQDAEVDKDDEQESHIVAEGKHREANRQHYGAARKTDEGDTQQAHFQHAREHLGMAEYHREKAAGHAKATEPALGPTVLDTLKASQDSALDLLDPQREQLKVALGSLKPANHPPPPPPPPDEPAEPTNSSEAMDYIRTSRECPKRVRERDAVLEDLRKEQSEETKNLSRTAQAGAPR